MFHEKQSWTTLKCKMVFLQVLVPPIYFWYPFLYISMVACIKRETGHVGFECPWVDMNIHPSYLTQVSPFDLFLLVNFYPTINGCVQLQQFHKCFWTMGVNKYNNFTSAFGPLLNRSVHDIFLGSLRNYFWDCIIVISMEARGK